MRQDTLHLKLRNEMGLDTSDMEQKRLLDMRIRLLRSKMASNSPVPNTTNNRAARVSEQKKLEDQIQLLEIGPVQTVTTGPNDAPKEVIEILDDDDDDDNDDRGNDKSMIVNQQTA